MAIRPTSLPRWATGVSVVEPSLGKKTQGWLNGERVPSAMLNWLQRNVGEWLMWLIGASRVLPWYQAVSIPSTTETGYRSVAFLDSLTVFTVMAIASTVRVSINAGLNWADTTLANGVAASVFWNGGLAANSERFVIVGQNGAIQTYENGAWTARSAAQGFTGTFWRVVWTGTQFVATGDFEVQTSPDGISWTRRASVAPSGGPNTLTQLRHVAHAGGRLVRVGAALAPGSSPRAEIWYSDDGGTTWTFAYQSVQAYFDNVAGTTFADGTIGFVATGESKTCASAGGIAWYEISDPAAGSTAAAWEDMLITGYGALVSPDGLNWYRMPYSGFSQAISFTFAAVSRAGFGLIVRPLLPASTYELARTAVQRWF